MTATNSHPPTRPRVTAFLCAALVAVGAVGFAYPGSGWSGDRSWFGRTFLLMTATVLLWRRYRGRETALERDVAERTREIDGERRREMERNRVLEMLVSNQPLNAVLDSVVRLMRSECPEALCAIVVKGANGAIGSEIAAAPDLPEDWLTALRQSCSLPEDVWRRHLQIEEPERDPAWRDFIGSLRGPAPAAIQSWPIGDAEETRGAVLLFFRDAVRPDGRTASRIASANWEAVSRASRSITAG